MRRAVAAVLVGPLVLAGGCGGDDDGGAEPGGAEGDGFAVLDRVVLPTRPRGLAAGSGAVWATNPEAGEVLRIDTATGEVAGHVQGGTGGDRGRGGRRLGLGRRPARVEIVRVDERTGETVTRIPLSNPAEIAFGFDSLWVVEGVGVTRIDAATSRVVARVAMPGSVGALGIGKDAVWVVGRGRGFGRGGGWDLARIDPETNRRTVEIELGEFVGATWVATTPGATWASVSSPERYGLARIDSRTNRVLGLAPLSRTRFPFLGRIAADDRSVGSSRPSRSDGSTRARTGSPRASTRAASSAVWPRAPTTPTWGPPSWSTATSGCRSRHTCDRPGREGLLTHGQRRRD